MIDKDKARRICDTACSGAFSAVSECGFYAREALPELLDRVEALEWLVEVQTLYLLWMHSHVRLVQFGGWRSELSATYQKALRDAGEE